MEGLQHCLTGMSKSIDDGADPLITTYSSNISSLKIRQYLHMEINGRYDLIISTLRKGSWIIDDYLLSTGLNIEHTSVKHGTGMAHVPIQNKNVLVFDDSIHTGEGIIEILSGLDASNKVTVCCLAIYDKARENIQEKYPDAELRFFKTFDIYDEASNPSSQAYFYAYFIIPYINNISINYSPDFTSASIWVADETGMDIDILAQDLVGVLKREIVGGCHRPDLESYLVSKNFNNVRLTILVPRALFERYLDDKPISDNDVCKIRISISRYDGFVDVTITPIFTPVRESMDDLDEDIVFESSRAFLNRIVPKVCGWIERSGKQVLTPIMMIDGEGNKRELRDTHD